jgi:hypothetical protein
MEFIIELLLANDKGIKKLLIGELQILYSSYCSVSSDYISSCSTHARITIRRHCLRYIILNVTVKVKFDVNLRELNYEDVKWIGLPEFRA